MTSEQRYTAQKKGIRWAPRSKMTQEGKRWPAAKGKDPSIRKKADETSMGRKEKW